MADEWDDKRKKVLRDLWATGMSTTKIALAMNTSKNSIVGKAHRLNLPSRPSPIKRGGAVKEAKPLRMKRVTLLTVEEEEIVAKAMLNAAPQIVPFSPAKLQTSESISRPCRFPFGTPRQPDFRYCDAPSASNRPYCHEHCALAYVNWRGAA